jgi:hypothetical protein
MHCHRVDTTLLSFVPIIIIKSTTTIHNKNFTPNVSYWHLVWACAQNIKTNIKMEPVKFTKTNEPDAEKNLNANQKIKVLELRNYLIRPGQRDSFIDYFENFFIQSQNILGGYTLGQYKVKGADDNFFWIRGFHNMTSRNTFLNDFYYGPVWKEHKVVANSMLLNNDNVHLLKPLNMADNSNDTTGFNSNWFGKEKGITVIDYFISNQKLPKLIEFVKTKYRSILKSAGMEDVSFWISETEPNEFIALPVFQDKNLLVGISFYKDELEYQAKFKDAETKMNDELKTEMLDLVTIKNTLVIYPTNKSFLIQKDK